MMINVFPSLSELAQQLAVFAQNEGQGFLPVVGRIHGDVVNDVIKEVGAAHHHTHTVLFDVSKVDVEVIV